MLRVLKRPSGISVAVVLLLLLINPVAALAQQTIPAEPERSFNRIVSLAPSATEVIFAVGAGSKLVGVSRFCDYPEQASAIAKVGGYLDPSYEAILALKPDLVLTLVEHDQAIAKFATLGIEVVSVNHQNIAGVLESISALGQKLGHSRAAYKLRQNIENELAEVSNTVDSLSKPRVLVVVGGHRPGASVTSIYAAGRASFYDEMIKLAGGQNVCCDSLAKHPVLSIEGVYSLQPEFILDFVPSPAEDGVDPRQVLAQWQTLAELKAVKSNQVYVLSDEYLVSPGPRLVKTVKRIAAVLHPRGK